jgi:hypothetical protein
LFVKKDENSWTGETEEEEAMNSLFAIAVLTCLHGSLDVGYTRHLEDFVNKVEKRWSSDRQFLMPYLLGLYAIFEQFDDQREQVHVRLESVLTKQRAKRNVYHLPSSIFSVWHSSMIWLIPHLETTL